MNHLIKVYCMCNWRLPFVTTVFLVLASCANLTSESPGVATATPTPTPTPEPCSEQAIRELVDDAKQLGKRYREATESGRGLLPLLPDVQELRQDVDQLLELPGCTAKLKEALNKYVGVDFDHLLRVIENTKSETIDGAIDSALRWFEEHVGTLED
jgi:hypothetical protein